MASVARADWIAGERSQLGRYRLLRRLATGGMAEIYLARATAIEGFEKLVVLKRILPQYADNESFIRMFLAEARLAATLHHPNVVQVYDIGEDDGAYFFAMEYVEGVNLRQLGIATRRAGHALPLQHILHIITGMCAGLHYAHEKRDASGAPLGIVHRDVSPSNVLVTFDGGIKIVDFGIAKAANVSTSAGTLKGKIPYMSPEQCRGAQLDRRSDVFSIGTLLWELTMGARLFSADNEMALLAKVAEGRVPPPTTINPHYPPTLEAIVLRALAADLDQRYPSARELQLALEDFAHDARLPLSAARLQPFLREVCAEQIATINALHAAHHRDPSTHEAIKNAPTVVNVDPGESSSVSGVDLTGLEPPAPDDETTTAHTATVAAPTRPSPVATPRRWVGATVGLFAAIGLGTAGGLWLLQGGSPPEPTGAPTEAPADAASPTSDPPSNAVPLEGPGSNPGTISPSRAPTTEANAQTEPLDDPANARAEDSPETRIEPPAEPSAEPPPSATSPPRARRGRGRRSTSRPSSGKRSSSTPSTSSPKETPWDPKAAPPPGL